MKKLLCLLMALMMLISLNALAEAKNLIANGGFSEVDAAGMPEDWNRGMWHTDSGISSLYISEDGYDGNCAVILCDSGLVHDRFDLEQDIFRKDGMWLPKRFITFQQKVL